MKYHNRTLANFKIVCTDYSKVKHILSDSSILCAKSGTYTTNILQQRVS